MDPTMLAVAAVNIVTGYLARRGAALVDQAGDSVAQRAGEAVSEKAGELWRWMRERLGREQGADVALERLDQVPDDPRRQGAVEFLLEQVIERDQALADQLAALIAAVQKEDPQAGIQITESGAVAVGGDIRMSGTAVAGRDLTIGSDAAHPEDLWSRTEGPRG